MRVNAMSHASKVNHYGLPSSLGDPGVGTVRLGLSALLGLPLVLVGGYLLVPGVEKEREPSLTVKPVAVPPQQELDAAARQDSAAQPHEGRVRPHLPIPNARQRWPSPDGLGSSSTTMCRRRAGKVGTGDVGRSRDDGAQSVARDPVRASRLEMTGSTDGSSQARNGSPIRDTPERPLVSVVLPCYREPIPILKRALESILGQTYRTIEVVVVVDDPGDAAKVAFLHEEAAKDDRVRVLENATNLGPWGSYNRGVREASGELIAIQDSDDVSDASRIECLTGFLLDHPDIGVVGSALQYVDEASGRSLLRRSYPADAATAIRRYCPLAHPTTLRWARLFAEHGGYDESSAYRHAADYELWCRWHVGGVRMANVPEPLYRYFQSNANFKARNVRAILRDTVRIRWRYARRLRYGASDYLSLALEAIAAATPSRIIVAAFYAVNRRRSARQH
jgi:glycosyltransferase involved in cell wall biosynthesis